MESSPYGSLRNSLGEYAFAQWLHIIGLKHDRQRKDSSLVGDLLSHFYQKRVGQYPEVLRKETLEELEKLIEEEKVYSETKEGAILKNAKRRIDFFTRMFNYTEKLWS